MAIVIPVYKEMPDDMEMASIQQTILVLNRFSVILIHPNDLNVDAYKKLNNNIECVSCHPIYFKGIDGYNSLMLSSEFYKNFLKYTFILICQPDAWVFRDDTDYWLSLTYDYMGAPWVSSVNNGTVHYTHPVGGNGGFSLRNVKHSIRVLQSRKILKSPIECWKYMKQFHKGFGLFLRVPVWMAMCVGFRNNARKFIREFSSNEDVFWSVHASNINATFKPAPAEVQLDFAWETCAPQLFELRNGKLPMGCHAWNKRYTEFWTKHIKYTQQ